MHPNLKPILAKALAGEGLAKNDAVALMPLFRKELLDLMAIARLAASAAGVKPVVCGVVNARSGSCSEDCAFCPQSRLSRNEVAPTPLLEADEFLRRAERAADRGLTNLSIVTAGRRPSAATIDRACACAEAVRGRVDITLCASLGELSLENGLRLKAAGFSRYHHNLETSRSFFPSVCTSHSYDDRLATIASAKAAGLLVCSGGVFGLGESIAERLEFIEDLEVAGVDSIPVNFLIPTPGTPLGERPHLPAREALAILIMLRLLLPGRNIIMAAGRRECLGELGSWVVPAGVNGLMVGDFLTQRGTRLEEDLRLLQMVGWI